MVDISADLALIDDVEAVDLDTAANGRTWGDVVAYRGSESIVEGEPSGGGYLYREAKFRLEGPPTGAAYDPKVGDVITAAGVEWVIQEVATPSVHSCDWRLICRTPHITEDVLSGLQDVVTLYPSVDSIDAWGSKISTHTAAHGTFAAVPAKIVLRSSVPEDYAGQKQFLEIYDIYVDQQLPQLHNGDVIEDATGKTFTVVSWRQRGLIDKLSVIECELRIQKP